MNKLDKLSLVIIILAIIYFFDGIVATPKGCSPYRVVTERYVANNEHVLDLSSTGQLTFYQRNSYIRVCRLQGFLPIKRSYVIQGHWNPTSVLTLK